MTWQEQLAQLVERRIGIGLRSGSALGTLERFVANRMEVLGVADAAGYVELIGAEGVHGDELARLTAVVTNGQTSFFRDNDQFEAFGLVMRELSRTLARPLSVWSAACSTGEEAYSLAILAADLGVEVEILGTDINRGFLKVAEHGTYGEWSLRQLPQHHRERFFEHTAQGAYIVGEATRRHVRFAQLNLVEAPPPQPWGKDAQRWDIVLCRNLFIYYRRPLVRTIVRRMTEALEPHGWLFVGVAETLRDLGLPVHPVSVGRRPG